MIAPAITGCDRKGEQYVVDDFDDTSRSLAPRFDRGDRREFDPCTAGYCCCGVDRTTPLRP